MIPFTPRRNTLLFLGLVVLAAIVVGGPVNALPLFSDHTGPTDLTISSFERLDAGCADEVGKFTHSGTENGSYTKTAFIRTGNETAKLSAWTERTSPAGADLSTFRVHIDSHGTPRQNASCTLGVQYRITLTPYGGSPPGLLPDAHGTRILWLENGRYSGCSASVTSPLEDQCHRFMDDSRPERTWVNGSR